VDTYNQLFEQDYCYQMLKFNIPLGVKQIFEVH